MSYSAGIIGAGGIAGLGILGMHAQEDIGRKKFVASHAGGYEATPGIDLVAIAEPNSEKRERFGAAWDIREPHQYADHHEMLADEDLDVISICTPTMVHYRHVIDCALADTPPSLIWCEKPIDSQLRAAEEMIETCDNRDIELVINHSFRFSEKIQQLRSAIQRDSLVGEVHSVNAQFRMELLRNSTHLLDLLTFLLESRATEVSGYLTGSNEAVEALAVDQQIDDSGGGGFVVMQDGTFVTVDCTVPRAPSSMSIHLIGSEGKLYLNQDDGEWRYWSLLDGNHVEQPIPGIDGSWTWEEDYTQSFANAVDHIVDLLDGTGENMSPGTEAIRSLEIITGFYLSHYTDSTVSLPLANPLKDIRITSW